MKIIDTDYLVIGSGLAGLMTAINLSPHGAVLVATKKDISESNSNYAQGGIACAISEKDSIDAHVADTLATGCGLSKPEVVREILSMAPSGIRKLEELGLEFERFRENTHEYDLGREGGHSRRRVLHAGDITGQEIMRVVIERARESDNITIRPGLMAIDLVTKNWLGRGGEDRCIGAYFLDTAANEIIGIRARHTVLATGGAGKVYSYTSNPDVATGDGVAMGWRAGLPIHNMEFVQFHPTCLFHPKAKSYLISEAVRGEGALLVNADGESFTERFDPRGSLAPRDIVARAIDNEMKQRGDPCVYLDISHRSAAFLTERFPNIYQTCREYGFDMAREPIPVVPAAHYFCGGIEADAYGHTAIPHLYAVGEVACTGLHGANRLASNSLLEALVCSCKAAEAIACNGDGGDNMRIDIPDWQSGNAVPSDEAVVVAHNWNEVRTCMWDYVGIVRTDKRLERAERRIRTLRYEIRQYYLDYLVTADVLELRNIAAVAELVVRSAAMRRESRGLNFTLDYPGQNAIFERDTVIQDAPGESIKRND
jgi:L-aspartate oxidase